MDCFKAALSNQTEIIQEYLRYGDVNKVDEKNASLLHYAARGNAMDVANLLLMNHINPNIADCYGETPLFETVRTGKIGFMKLLLRYHANVNVANKLGEPLLFRVIMKNNQEMLELLLANSNFDYFSTNLNGENILFYALRANNSKLFIEVAKNYPQLLEAINYRGTNLLMYSLQCNNHVVFDFLFDESSNLYYCDKEKNNVLFYAARYASYELCEKLLQHHPIIEGKNLFNEDIMDMAKSNSSYVVDLWENYRLSYEYQQYLLTYPYHTAVIKRDYDLLMYGKKDIKKRDSLGISLEEYIQLVNDPNIHKIFTAK